MGRIEKTIFICYRHADVNRASAIFRYLAGNGYDVFFCFNSIADGDIERVVNETIRSRAHFIVLIGPSTLERSDDPNDWVRREIEIAIEARRNIISLMFGGFDFNSASGTRPLTGYLAALTKGNALSVSTNHFEADMTSLRRTFLDISLETVLHPPSLQVMKVVKEHQSAAALGSLHFTHQSA
jgi:hypothetical protein